MLFQESHLTLNMAPPGGSHLCTTFWEITRPLAGQASGGLLTPVVQGHYSYDPALSCTLQRPIDKQCTLPTTLRPFSTRSAQQILGSLPARPLSAGILGSLPPTHSMKGTLGSLPHTHSVQGSWGAYPAPAQCMGSSFWVHTACNCLCLSLSDTAHSHGKVEHSRVGGRPAGGAAGPPTDIVS